MLKNVLISYLMTLFIHIPNFYGLPKIHKQFNLTPPLRPIISSFNTLLTPISKFLTHVLQPLVQIYDDYLLNSTSLCAIFQNLHVSSSSILVSLDVKQLYPSIPHPNQNV